MSSASWMNQIETWFGILTRQAIRRGAFRSVKELVERIETFTAAWNAGASPFAWVKSADEILAKAVRKPRANSESGHELRSTGGSPGLAGGLPPDSSGTLTAGRPRAGIGRAPGREAGSGPAEPGLHGEADPPVPPLVVPWRSGERWDRPESRPTRSPTASGPAGGA